MIEIIKNNLTLCMFLPNTIYFVQICATYLYKKLATIITIINIVICFPFLILHGVRKLLKLQVNNYYFKKFQINLMKCFYFLTSDYVCKLFKLQGNNYYFKIVKYSFGLNIFNRRENEYPADSIKDKNHIVCYTR